MTKEEAIEILENTSFFGMSMDDIDTAIEMAVNALKRNCADVKQNENVMTLEDAIKIFINRGYVEIENGQIFDGDAWRNCYKVISDALIDGRLIPISVIADIRTEIDERYDLEKQNNIYVAEGLEIAEIIIDKHIKVQNNDTTN